MSHFPPFFSNRCHPLPFPSSPRTIEPAIRGFVIGWACYTCGRILIRKWPERGPQVRVNVFLKNNPELGLATRPLSSVCGGDTLRSAPRFYGRLASDAQVCFRSAGSSGLSQRHLSVSNTPHGHQPLNLGSLSMNGWKRHPRTLSRTKWRSKRAAPDQARC